MKTSFFYILIVALSINSSNLFSQETCKVLKSEIAGKYEGKCKNGLAHGKGRSEGKDLYEGDFKNGLPHGKGKYTWSTGEVYEGKWKEGKREGEGKYIYKVNGVDSSKYGIWSDDAFLKKITPTPYKVMKVNSVSRYSFQKMKDGKRILFSFQQGGMTNNTIYNLLFSQSSGTTVEIGSKQGFENVEFPFSCKITYTTLNGFKTSSYDVEFEFIINEPGEWIVILNN